MKKDVSPTVMISVAVAALLALVLIGWKVFLAPSGGGNITPAASKARKDAKEGP